MHNDPDYVTLSLILAMFVTSVTWVVLEARHSDRLGKDRTPMSPRTRNLLMWLGFIEIAAITFWQTQHGSVPYP